MAKSGSKASGTIMRLKWASSALILALAPFCFVPICLAQEDTTITVDVRLVRILATVKDPAGNPIGTLAKDAFTVKDNGVPQRISVFEHQTEQPLNVGILIDTSGSTYKDLKYETDSVVRFVKALFREGNTGDVASLYSFNSDIVQHNNFTRNAAAIERSLRLLRGEAGTSLYDAVMLASRDIQDR
ncbi:MAG: von Willebrand factor, type, partial [Bryobacterales bacterium]|nr:von Willebrand factor, type [Bryobacterales bacterium]